LNERKQDMDYVLCFLLTYRSFTTPRTLFDTCVSRYKSLDITDETDSQNRIHPTQLRICTVLAKWVEVNVGDFDDDLSSSLISFIEEDLTRSSAKLAQKLRDAIKKKALFTKRSTIASPPPMHLPYAFNGSFELIDIPPLEMARQMTIIEFGMFRKISPQECLSIKEKERCAPNLTLVSARFNKVNAWVQSEILRPPSAKLRSLVLLTFIQIAQCCMDLHNYNSCFEILSGLNATAVWRLKKTWTLIPESYMLLFDAMQLTLSSEKSYKEYRETLHTIQPPCVPYLGVYLTDLVMAEEGNLTKLDAGMINFEKNYMFYKIIKEIQLYQQTGYTFECEPSIRDYLLVLNGSDEDTLYRHSLYLEPREVK